jgi:4-diphosphocytidyl-2C-methyl-D-erythritol kinase
MKEETVDEHHGDDFPKGLLKKSVNKFLNDLKKKNEKDYDKVEDIIKKHFNVDEASMTGTGASFQAGSGEGYMSPRAFGDDKKKKLKTYKSIGYKEV